MRKKINDFEELDTLTGNEMILAEIPNGAYRRIKSSKFGQSSGSSGKLLNFVSPLDQNGLVWWLGTLEGSTSWINPAIRANTLTASASGNHFNQDPKLMTSREAFNYHTAQGSNQWVKWDLLNRRLKPSILCYSNRFDANTTPRTRFWEGSNDDVNWVILAHSVNHASASYWHALNANSAMFFRYFRIRQLDSDYLIINNVDFYGELINA